MIQVQSALKGLDNGSDEKAKARHASIYIEGIQ
jgi:hypothetical protein